MVPLAGHHGVGREVVQHQFVARAVPDLQSHSLVEVAFPVYEQVPAVFGGLLLAVDCAGSIVGDVIELCPHAESPIPVHVHALGQVNSLSDGGDDISRLDDAVVEVSSGESAVGSPYWRLRQRSVSGATERAVVAQAAGVFDASGRAGVAWFVER